MIFMVALLCNLTLLAQEEAYFFAIPNHDNTEIAFANSQLGTYKDESGHNQIIITNNRMIGRDYSVRSISKETVRESSAFNVRGEYLTGFYKDGDSVKVTLEDDIYLFVHKDMYDILGGTANGTYLADGKNAYYFYKKLDSVKCRLFHIKISGKKIEVAEFDAINNQEVVDSVLSKESNDGVTILAPSVAELEALKKGGVFEEYLVYRR